MAARQECATKEHHDFSNAFETRREKDRNVGWNLLQSVFSFHFKPGNASEPFGPISAIGQKRSMIPSDLTEDQLSALAATIELIDDPEYRARISDVLWLRRHDAAVARVAVNAYLQSGSRLEDPEHWVPSMERYERAARLARQVDSKGDLPKTVLRHLEARVLHYNGPRLADQEFESGPSQR